jgi:RNA recognition motif-containing protein
MATKSLYVGNIPYSMTESGLMELFEPYGVSSARVIEGRGFAFVDVEEDKVSQAIEERHQSVVGGRTIVVSEARPKDDRPRDRYSR